MLPPPRVGLRKAVTKPLKSRGEVQQGSTDGLTKWSCSLTRRGELVLLSNQCCQPLINLPMICKCIDPDYSLRRSCTQNIVSVPVLRHASCICQHGFIPACLHSPLPCIQGTSFWALINWAKLTSIILLISEPSRANVAHNMMLCASGMIAVGTLPFKGWRRISPLIR